MKGHFACYVDLSHWKCIVSCNRQSAENNDILAVQYAHKLFNIYTYRQHLASAIYGCSSFKDMHLHLRKKQFEKMNCATRQIYIHTYIQIDIGLAPKIMRTNLRR